jgi:anti-sigma factor ChrR (cupin superfamily)
MTPHHSREEAQEQGALYALGALSHEDAQTFEQHLTTCSLCADEVAAFAVVTQELAHAAVPRTPRPEVRARVLEQVATPGLSRTRPIIDKDSFRFVGSSWLDWAPGNTPGVEIKVLSIDQARNYFTTLVRMAPGAILASHRHADAEESYLLEGELLVAGVLMHPGDYCRADAGSLHAGVTTKTGCVFIAVASLQNEWFVEA